MPYRTITITTSIMREINRSVILEIIRRESPISRTLIAERMGASLPTVMRIVNELIAEGLVQLYGKTEWSGGRRRPLLELNLTGAVVLGIDLGGFHPYGAVLNLGGAVLVETRTDAPQNTAEDHFNHLISITDSLLSSSQIYGRRIIGMGVGVPGIVQHGDGVVAWAPAQQWRDFPLKSRLVELYDFPILIENDINLAALGELWGGFGLNTQNIIVLSVDRGIGCGIIIDRILYRGSNGAAGEVGSLLVGCDSLDHKSEMARALEGVASPAAVMDRARAALKNRQPPYDLDRLTPADVIHAAQEGESWAQPIISEMVDYLSVAVGNLTIILNPDVIVLTGSVFESSKYLANQIRNRIQGAIPVVPRLVMSSLGRQAVVMGAIAGILYPNPDDSRLRKLP